MFSHPSPLLISTTLQAASSIIRTPLYLLSGSWQNLMYISLKITFIIDNTCTPYLCLYNTENGNYDSDHLLLTTFLRSIMLHLTCLNRCSTPSNFPNIQWTVPDRLIIALVSSPVTIPGGGGHLHRVRQNSRALRQSQILPERF